MGVSHNAWFIIFIIIFLAQHSSQCPVWTPHFLPPWPGKHVLMLHGPGFEKLTEHLQGRGDFIIFLSLL